VRAFLACAVAAARAAGDHALRHARRRTETLRAFAHDVKLRLDRECQQAAERVIRTRFPGHTILGEEDAAEAAAGAASDAPVWIVDPIDGTVNFSHGLPFWCASVGVRQDGRVAAGAVYAPAMRELYTASLDTPALRNGVPIRVSRVAALRRALIMTGLDKSMDPARPPFEVFRAVSAAVQKARVVGTAALDLCRVAAGQADGYFESGIYVWDVAAAGLIVERAGGRAETLAALPGHRISYLASNGRLHAALRRVVLGAMPACRRRPVRSPAAAAG
jgi:myo-inositol-1(or 4)-monophosphatase